jgi:serine/threonine protein kinase
MQNTTILNYKLIKKIGEGGFAEIWLAEHIKLGTKVAVKVLDKKIVEIEGFKDRFLRAAKLLNSLKHPNIVEIIDFDDSEYYVMVMEYLEGPMFREYINQNYNPNEPLKFLPLFLQVVEAVGFIHQKGIIHRDIKPTNVILINLNNQLRAKLLDFDIAKDLNSDHTATLTTQQMGTITYMSPEQVLSAKNIDIKSDIYSLGIMLFYVLTGKPVYSSQVDSQFKLMEKIVKEPLPDLKLFNLNIPDWADKILKKATDKDPIKRFQTCKEFADAINKELNQPSQIDTEKTVFFQEPSPQNTIIEDKTVMFEQSTKKKFPILIVGIVLVAVLAGLSYLFLRDSTTENKEETTLNPVKDSTNVPQNKKVFNNSDRITLFEDAKKAHANKEYTKAIELYLKVIENGEKKAYNNLGSLYGFDKKNKELGIKYLKLGSEEEDIDAKINLGGLYLNYNEIKNAKKIFQNAYNQDKKKTMEVIQKIRKQIPNFMTELK